MRWWGPASTVTALAQCVVRHRTDGQSRRVVMEIPDHVDVLCRMAQGGQMRCSVSTVIGHAPPTSVVIYGTEGTLKVAEGGTGDSPFELWAAGAATSGCAASTSRRRRWADGGSRRSSSTQCAVSSR